MQSRTAASATIPSEVGQEGDSTVAVDRSVLTAMGGIGLLVIWAACFGVAFALRF